MTEENFEECGQNVLDFIKNIYETYEKVKNGMYEQSSDDANTINNKILKSEYQQIAPFIEWMELFYERVLTHSLLKPLFVKQFIAIANATNVDIIDYILHHIQRRELNYLFLQEVNAEQFQRICDSSELQNLGFRIISTGIIGNNKTCGVILTTCQGQIEFI